MVKKAVKAPVAQMDRVAPIKFMAKQYVYILESKIDQKLYIGVSNDVQKRLLRHNAGKVVSTRYRRPFSIIYVEEFENRAKALQRERYLKSLKSSGYIKKYIIRPDSSVG